MEAIGCQFVQSGDNACYYVERANVSATSCMHSFAYDPVTEGILFLMKEPEFLPGRQASIIYKGKRIGAFGIVHPKVRKVSLELTLLEIK